MFWDKGYAPSQNLEALLEKENVTVEEFLDDEDILQECKTQKKNLINYFTRRDVISRLVALIITEPSEDLPMAQRFRHANMACEILTLGLPSIDEKILSDADTLKSLYSYLENDPPLNPLLSSFFSKTFSMLFTKKAEQDWFLYQHMCLQLLEYIKSQNNFLDLICKHFATPVIPDLIMQMMKDVEGATIKRNLYEWLTEEKLVERLIDILANPKEIEKHANAAEFLCDLIQQGRTMRQTESENDSFEPAFNGSNPILQVIESEATIEALLNVILEPNALESAIVSGISVVLTLIKPVVFVDELNLDRLRMMQNREKDIHEEILATVIRVIAPRLKEFNELLRNPPTKPEIVTSAANLTPPFGMTRLHICRMFTVLLQTRNEEITKAICETDFFVTLLTLFKQYCWNNFLHSEVEKCLQLIFYTNLSNNNSTQGSTIVNDGSFNKNTTGDNNLSIFTFGGSVGGHGDNIADDSCNAEVDGGAEESSNNEIETNAENITEDEPKDKDIEMNENVNTTKHEEVVNEKEEEDEQEKKEEQEELKHTEEKENLNNQQTKDMEVTADKVNEDEHNASDTTAVPAETAPSVLQTHVIAQCKVVPKLIDCWQHNKELQSAEKGRRLGFMGHLMKIFKHITMCISEFEHIGALIENNLTDSAEMELWQSIINPIDGDFTQALAIQNKMLANCNAHEAADYSQHLPKEFLNDNIKLDYFSELTSKWNNIDPSFFESNGHDDVRLGEAMKINLDFFNNDNNAENDLDLFQIGRNIDQEDDDDDDDDNTAIGDAGGHSLFKTSSASTSALHSFGVTSNPWDTLDPFNDITATNSNEIAPPASTPWATDFPSDNFADFDAHFSSFTNDLGDSLYALAAARACDNDSDDDNDSPPAFNIKSTTKMTTSDEEYDNNANVEKSAAVQFDKYYVDPDEDDTDVRHFIYGVLNTLKVGPNTDDAVLKELPSEATINKSPAISNGPTNASKDNDNEKLNNSNDITAMPTNDAAATAATATNELTNKFPNAALEEEKQQLETNAADVDVAAAVTEKKIASNIAAVNTVEIAPTT